MIRIITWNSSRGLPESKLPILGMMSPTIAVVPECPRPRTPDSQWQIWSGDRPDQGLGVFSTDGYTLEPMPRADGVGRFIVPVRVSGPLSFNLLAIWAHRRPTYVDDVCTGVRRYQSFLNSAPSVVIGDFNSNPVFDRHYPAAPHSKIISCLREVGLVSAYHAFFGERPGEESRPTLYYRWKRENPFHIDYCFLPSEWVPRIKRVTVGTYEELAETSDHRPVVVDLEERGER